MRLFVPLTQDEFEALREIARLERRRPQDQAAVILAQSLANEAPQREPDTDNVGEHTRGVGPQEAERVSA